MPAEAPAAPPPPAPAASTPVEISASQLVPPSASPSAPPKRGSAMERLHQDLQKKAGGIPPSDTPATPSPAKPASGPQPDAVPTKEGAAPQQSAAPSPAPADEGKDKGKTNPWKLLDHEKAARAKAEKEAQELRGQIVPEQERSKLTERMTTLEKRNRELEDEIRYVNYSKSQEFQDKYLKPYEAAWKRATAELAEIAVTGQDGNPRAATVQDLQTIINLPLGQARAVANELFGDFANEMMAHRKSIRELFDLQHTALEEARKSGQDREQQRAQQMQASEGELTRFVADAWKKSNDAVLADNTIAPFFKPKEGDEAWNKKLDEGFNFVDETLAKNVRDPNLTPEQRTDLVRRHTAIRNRAAGWGALRVENGRLQKRVAELEKELGQYKATTPAAAGTAQAPGAQARPRGMAGLMSDLQKIAKPI